MGPTACVSSRLQTRSAVRTASARNSVREQDPRPGSVTPEALLALVFLLILDVNLHLLIGRELATLPVHEP